MTRRLRRASLTRVSSLICSVIWLAVACEPETVPATQVLVTVESDLAVGTEITAVRIAVRDRAGMRSTPLHVFELADGTPRGDEVTFPFSFGIVKKNQAEFQLTTVGLNDEAEVVEYKVNGKFVDQKTLGLSVVLGSVCAGQDCPSGETCYPRARDGVAAGQCGELVDDSLDPIDPSDDLPDAGSELDAEVPEAGSGGGGGSAGGPGRAGAGAGGAGAGAGGAGMGGTGGAGTGGAGGMMNTCDACRPGETCVDGRCQCSTAVMTYYEDADEDGYGDPEVPQTVCGAAPEGYVSSDDDCCDIDQYAYPGQTEGFDVPTECDETDYDYNCDGGTEVGYTTFGVPVCCSGVTPDQPGWLDGYIPGCGETGNFGLCDACQWITGTLTQICR